MAQLGPNRRSCGAVRAGHEFLLAQMDIKFRRVQVGDQAEWERGKSRALSQIDLCSSFSRGRMSSQQSTNQALVNTVTHQAGKTEEGTMGKKDRLGRSFPPQVTRCGRSDALAARVPGASPNQAHQPLSLTASHWLQRKSVIACPTQFDAVPLLVQHRAPIQSIGQQRRSTAQRQRLKKHTRKPSSSLLLTQWTKECSRCAGVDTRSRLLSWSAVTSKHPSSRCHLITQPPLLPPFH